MNDETSQDAVAGVDLASLAGTLAAHAADVDEKGEFPTASVDELRRSGLFGLLVPAEFGGLGGSLADLAHCAAELSAGCLSTALIWAMHCQQVDSVVRFGTPRLQAQLLPRVATGAVYLASVTSERGSGGRLLTAGDALVQADDGVGIDRDAPIVTGGECAEGFLITMRDAADAAPNRVSLVYADRQDLDIEQTGSWNALGMRGTRSVGLTLKGTVAPHNIVGERGGYRTVAVESTMPLAHIGWSACWLGTARAAYREVVGLIRSPKRPRGIDPSSPLTAERLARIRMDLELVSAYLHRVVDEVAAHRRQGRTVDAPQVQIHLNTLKVVAAERTFAAVNALIELVGLSTGYSRDSPVPLERHFRDLRSASLNYANERLLVANGSLALLDRTAVLA